MTCESGHTIYDIDVPLSQVVTVTPVLTLQSSVVILQKSSSNEYVKLQANSLGGLAPYGYNVNWNDGGTGFFTTNVFDHFYRTGGTYAISVVTTDHSGQTVTNSVTVTLIPLSANLTYSCVNLACSLQVKAIGGDQPWSITVIWGDTNTSKTQLFQPSNTSSTWSVRHTYANPGNYTVVALVKDAAGASAQATASYSLKTGNTNGSGTTTTTPGLVGPLVIPWFLIVGLIALAGGLMFALEDVELSERDKYLVGILAFVLGTLLLVVRNLAAPYVPSPF